MKLWRELLINGLQNENYKINHIDDKILEKIIKDECYKVLLQVKNIIDDEKLSDNDSFNKIEKLLSVLEKNNIFCNRHDFG